MPELAKALADVRRAYRLLQAYQLRVNDMLTMVCEELERADVSFEQWYVQGHSPPPQRVKRFFGKWAWDMLPGHSLGVQFSGAGSNNSVLQVTLHVFADTGFQEFEGAGEPDPAAFTPVEESRSELQWSLARRPAGVSDVKATEALRQVHGDLYAEKEDHRYGGVLNGAEVATWLWSADLADLRDRDAVRTRVIMPTLTAIASERQLSSNL